ncbi:MAG: lipoate--protein ligase family protein [Methanomassiliicoccales archaeon]|nr:lipoate--protein ligase family protein [Methanomassiliicoccales archaeon]NYT14721.1 lipoate--protein ligase family protein [Methanomassiliicoccales archaeon]
MFWRLLDTDKAAPAYTAACDEAIVKARQKKLVPDTLHLYRRDRPTISLGYFERIDEAVNLEAVEKRGVQLVRRFSGGSAIYTDQNQIIYAVVMRRDLLPEDPNEIYEIICSALIRAMDKMGLDAEFKPVNDVLIRGKKVSGSAQKLEKDVVIQHGTVIVDCDFDMMFDVLRTGDKKVRSQEGMTSISKELGRKVSMEEVKTALIQGFEETLSVSVRKGSLTHYEEKCIKRLIETKYGNDEYTQLR